ncbi:3-mercaptopyruvate sulfurtransferase SseA [Deinobacterium chartae]|uniref:3-mercaptopyruvate sulfurtransferase SseA n=1 Tax=Deinobacterium chartae TaxID=521158 RepID=A0A841HZL8_9DEIO|nr:hypothetical protein [Deinobacterium chartae]MBB6097332.1 3-mercaptopyruvate sulfurtransferase SseA [Deinobacterium chartae]
MLDSGMKDWNEEGRELMVKTLQNSSTVSALLSVLSAKGILTTEEVVQIMETSRQLLDDQLAELRELGRYP